MRAVMMVVVVVVVVAMTAVKKLPPERTNRLARDQEVYLSVNKATTCFLLRRLPDPSVQPYYAYVAAAQWWRMKFCRIDVIHRSVSPEEALLRRTRQRQWLSVAFRLLSRQ